MNTYTFKEVILKIINGESFMSINGKEIQTKIIKK